MNFYERIVISKMKKEMIKRRGVLIDVKSELNLTDRTDFENSSFKECKWVDIHVENEKKTLIGVCYKALLTSAQEDEGLTELILKASNEITLVMGDFNFPGIK